MNEDTNKDKIDFNLEKEINSHNPKPITWLQKITFFFLLSGMMVFAFWAKTNLIYNVKSDTAILVAAVSIMITIVVLGFSFGTGTGKEIIARFLKRFKIKSGKYVNTLFSTKSGVILEVFKKVNQDTLTFKVANQTYTRNPALLFNYKSIPTYLHREGTPDPVNIFENRFAGIMSNAELDNVMNSQGAFDIKEWLNRNKFLFIIFAALVILAAIAAAYGSITNMQMLRDGTYTAIKVASKGKLP